MKKVFIYILVFLGAILVLWISARLTGALQFYKVGSSANDPAIKVGERVFTTNLKKPLPYQFITFTSKYEDSVLASYSPDYRTGVHYVYRLCGIAGDVIRMKDGVLFVNDKDFDKELKIKNQFKFSNKYLDEIDEEDIPKEDASSQFYSLDDSTVITLDKTQLKKYQAKIKFVPVFFYDTSYTGGPFKWFDKGSVWTTDNFGPITIPAGYYFVLGDNRHLAMDNRYIGFVSKTDIKGVVLDK